MDRRRSLFALAGASALYAQTCSTARAAPIAVAGLMAAPVTEPSSTLPEAAGVSGGASAGGANASGGVSTVRGRDWFIFLESGKPVPGDKAAVQQMQQGHLYNFKRLFAEGKLFAAGPLRDPTQLKRGIVVVRAADHATLMSYFQPDDYVREGYMSVNAQPADVKRALNHTGIDPNSIEENRILLISRATAPADDVAIAAQLTQALSAGTIGAWYRLEAGPIRDVAFSHGTEETALRQALSQMPAVVERKVLHHVWPQWLGKGVLKPGAA